MAILSKGQTFSSGDQVTSTKLNDIVDDATFVTGTGNATDNSTLAVHASGYLQVKDLGIDTAQLAASAVTEAKIEDGAVTADKLAATAAFQAGMVMPYAPGAAPPGWLLCDGSAISRTTYAALFSAVSTTYGVGNGSTTFNIPDLRGRVPAGDDNMGGVAASRLTSGGSGIAGATIGASGGAETHTLVTGEIPAHTHTMQTWHHDNNTSAVACDPPSATNSGSLSTPEATYDGAEGAAINNAGGGGAHPNVQPTIILSYIIKT